MRSLWLAACALVLLCGCGDASPGDSSTVEGRLDRIVYINPLPGSPLWDGVGGCMKSEAKKHGIELLEQGPPGGNVDVQAMSNLLSQAVAVKAPAIATWSSAGGAAFDALFARVHEYGGAVATVLSTGTKEQDFQVGIDYGEWARIQVRAVAARAGQQRMGVIWQQGTGDGYADYVVALKDEVSRHPNVTLEALEYDDGNFDADLDIANRMLTLHQDLNILVVYSGFPGAVTAVREQDRVGRVAVFMGSDFPDAVVKDIKDGLVAGVHRNDPCLMGRTVVLRLRDVYASRPVKKNYEDGSRMYTAEEFLELMGAK